ncbi:MULTISPECIES: LysR family transcriptional regulator [Pseudomonas]|jgi:DNA-binding transcriptional LysR family regulator|uniref:LysR family transcriptional regulator n=3 Tax=Pseudomonas TaxID=286 RepID=A0A5M8GBV9_9PSED|nr:MULTISPECIES: LysR family transcriptional regulator [Pseudomonas]ATN13507.1 LysR family transcriptional regulator [Pseudomonas sp. FDAARGOS_380]KAA6193648.1 LysR family transcriptional regulator [Pseudomonas lactis]KRC88405.1 LysR family transcriptional regulator [Pseudomonas sp. Root9]MBK3441983.1 LysR family transcriptional regulator [Pseudomonas lactis]MDY4299278.1 LysR family transcriptional regulator [Pseudomonas salmasensis]
MDRLQAMRVFVTVVDLGSQSAAADHLDLSRPVVSRYLAELEDWVGARLLHRTTRKLSLTAAGGETLPRCRQLLDLCGDMQAAVSEPDDAPRGLLRLSVSTSFGQAQLGAAIAEYVKRYPLVTVDLQMLDRTVNLVDERIDLAIRTSNDLDPNLIARRLTVCRSVVCATPAYLREHPAPQKVEDLARHNCLTHSYFGKSLWHFEENGEHVSVPVHGNITANEASTLMRVTLAGAGVAMLPSYQAGELIRSGELVRLLPHAEPRQMNIYAVYASRKHMPSALRSLLDFLVLRFPEEPVWDVGL